MSRTRRSRAADRATSSTSPTAARKHRGARSSICCRRSGRTRSRASCRGSKRRSRRRGRARAPRGEQLLAAASHHAGASRRARRAMSSRGACTATSPPPPNRGPRISPNCCWCRASARARCGRLAMVAEVRAWRALPVHRSGALFAGAWRQGPASVSGADSASTTRPSASEIGRSATPSSAATKNSARSGVWTTRRGGWSGMPPVLRSKH